MSYDFNGNIINLSRNGLKSDNSFGLIDNLNYTYNTNSNKILKVDDASNETASFNNVTGNDYTYRLDGSLKSDNNKGIDSIQYNYLKLPKKIFLSGSRWISYQYDASGKKLKKTLSTGKVTDYVANKIYENGVLYQTAHDEGRVVNGIYEYDIKDHLGNSRVSFKDSVGIAKITQTNHVGAWGETLPTLSYVNNPKTNNFTYSTYEKENDFGINVFDAHARVYDAIAPRFWQQDAMSEKFSDLSPYNYAANNPLKFIDPDGNYITINYEDENGKMQTYRYNYGAKYDGTDNFIKTTISALNFLIDNAVDNEKTIQTLANDKEFNWNISKSDVNDGATSVANAGLPNGSLTTWDPQGAYVDANQNTHSPIDGLLHEGGHAYIAYGNYQILKKGSGKQSKGDTEGRKKAEKEYYDRLDYFGKPEGNGWMNYEEKYVIQNYENPFMKQIMKEEPRPSHKGKFYKSENPYSRKPVSGTVPIYKPKK